MGSVTTDARWKTRRDERFFMFNLLFGALILCGLALVVAGFFERQSEATEAHMVRRLDRVATSPLGGLGRDSSVEAEKEFARLEETRMREDRKTTYLPTLSRFAEGNNWIGQLEDELQQVRSPWRATEIVAASVFGAMVTLVVALLLGMGFFAFLIALPVLLVPRLYVKMVRTAYFRRFDDQLGDALMLMSNSLRAGFSFMQSMEMVAQEAPAPISSEFARVAKEISLGVPVSESLMGMGDRVKSLDLNLVLVAVIIQREVGGALAQLLELIASVIRERQRIKGEIRTLTSQGRLTGMILGFMPFSVALAIFLVGKAVAPGEPSFIEPLINTSLGHMLLAGAFIWQMIGFWLIMRIVNIKV